MKLTLENKEYEKALEIYQYKYMKKKLSKKDSIEKFTKENEEKETVINLLRQILLNIFEYQTLEGIVKKFIKFINLV